ncbi:hypothetical protein PPERSA_06779 [Pseudocohnilembus persalinus]|uniref:Uncharacterized protein n=1 Tax=Pseudocohnilembus persalinus TaxID=266149 RepID=A0A0V0QS62_PSEPJ|nr:hypothetical protein PPERSA_06779 [Pseudocohnilembus persalinus]|eukprot:KRX05145.1 hypothetical protein PPERSA_06779 [Pseudocohnilembus persalinus]
MNKEQMKKIDENLDQNFIDNTKYHSYDLQQNLQNNENNTEKITQQKQQKQKIDKLKKIYKNSPVLDEIIQNSKYDGFVSADNDSDSDIQSQIKYIQEKQDQKLVEQREKNNSNIVQLLTSQIISQLKNTFLIEKGNDDKEAIFETNYFSAQQVLDDDQRKLMNLKLEEMKQNYLKMVGKVEQENQYLITKCKLLQEKITTLQSEQNSEEIVDKLLAVESNPYKIWKYFQEKVGNQFFFRIFEHPVPGMGIKFEEIDCLIENSKATKRSYKHHKLALDNQYVLFTQQCQQQLKLLQKKVDEKVKMMQKIKKESENIIEDNKKYESLIQSQKWRAEEYIQRQCPLDNCLTNELYTIIVSQNRELHNLIKDSEQLIRENGQIQMENQKLQLQLQTIQSKDVMDVKTINKNISERNINLKFMPKQYDYYNISFIQDLIQAQQFNFDTQEMLFYPKIFSSIGVNTETQNLNEYNSNSNDKVQNQDKFKKSINFSHNENKVDHVQLQEKEITPNQSQVQKQQLKQESQKQTNIEQIEQVKNIQSNILSIQENVSQIVEKKDKKIPQLTNLINYNQNGDLQNNSDLQYISKQQDTNMIMEQETEQVKQLQKNLDNLLKEILGYDNETDILQSDYNQVNGFKKQRQKTNESKKNLFLKQMNQNNYRNQRYKSKNNKILKSFDKFEHTIEEDESVSPGSENPNLKPFSMSTKNKSKKKIISINQLQRNQSQMVQNSKKTYQINKKRQSDTSLKSQNEMLEPNQSNE